MTIDSFGQKLTEKIPGVTLSIKEGSIQNDSIIQVFYKNVVENSNKPAYFLNGKRVNESILKSLHPNEIANVNVEKENFEIDSVKYFGKIEIETKANYKPRFISLTDLKLKYTNIKEHAIIFQIDDEIINADYEKYIIDANCILRVVVEKFENQKEKLNLNFIKVITKSEANLKKAKEIIIRGKEAFPINK